MANIRNCYYCDRQIVTDIPSPKLVFCTPPCLDDVIDTRHNYHGSIEEEFYLFNKRNNPNV